MEHPKEAGGKKVCGKQSTVFWGPSWTLRTGRTGQSDYGSAEYIRHGNNFMYVCKSYIKTHTCLYFKFK